MCLFIICSIYVCMYECMHACMYVYVYVYICLVVEPPLWNILISQLGWLFPNGKKFQATSQMMGFHHFFGWTDWQIIGKSLAKIAFHQLLDGQFQENPEEIIYQFGI